MWTLWLVACLASRSWEPCACPTEAHGVSASDGACSCLPHAEAEALPSFGEEFFVAPEGAGDGSLGSPWGEVDWAVVDAALAEGPVAVRFSAGTWDRRLDVLREDVGGHLLLLDGSYEERSVVPGIHTGFDNISRDHIVVRGFEVTGSADKGIFFNAGSHVVVENNVVHSNSGSPSIHLNYSNRTGLISEGFVVRSNHVYAQRGECIYIGGAEGTGEVSHHGIVVENNLVHGCYGADGKADGINIKDGLVDVLVRRNVVFDVDWGLELGSGGLYSGNLVFETRREGVQLNTGFGGFSGLRLVDTVVVRSGEGSFYAAPGDVVLDDIVVERFTSLEPGEAGLMLGDDLTIELSDVVLIGDRPVQSWGAPSVSVTGCGASAPEDVGLGIDCWEVAPVSVEPADLAGADGIYFTADDPWLLDGGAAL